MKEQNKNKTDLINEQKKMCKKYGAAFINSPLNFKIGISENVKEGVQPIHGLRHPPEGDTTGWYIWAGEYSDSPDFFKPLHVEHLDKWSHLITPFLGLEPGYRYLIAEDGNYVDVWEDLDLLNI